MSETLDLGGPTRAAAAGPRRGGHVRRLVSLGDQVLSGLSNFLTVALVARSTTPERFGHFSLAYAILLTLLTVSRGVWGTPISLAGSPAAALPAARRVLGAALTAAPVMAVIVVVPTLVLAPSAGWPLLVLIAVATPVVCAQDLCRFAAVSAERPWVAAVSDGIWVGFVVAGYVLRPGEYAALGFWLAGAAAGLLVAAVLLRIRPALRTGFRELRSWHSTGVGVAMSNIALQLGSYVVLALATLGIGAGGAATLRGASSVMAPVNTLLGFLSLALLPFVHRRPAHRHPVLVARVAGLLLLATAAWGVVLLLVPPRFGALLLGDTWALSRGILPWTVLEYLCISVGAAALLGLQAAQSGRLLARVAIGAALLLSSAGVVAACIAGTVTPFAIAQAAAAGLGAVIVWVLYLKVARRGRSGRERGPRVDGPPSQPGDPAPPDGAVSARARARGIDAAGGRRHTSSSLTDKDRSDEARGRR